MAVSICAVARLKTVNRILIRWSLSAKGIQIRKEEIKLVFITEHDNCLQRNFIKQLKNFLEL